MPYLQVHSADFASSLGVLLDGQRDHFKKDLNFDGSVTFRDTDGTIIKVPAFPRHPVDVPVPTDSSNAPPENAYPRYDFNGDGTLDAWFKTAPFKIDPDRVPASGDLGFNVISSPGFLRDIDVLADPAFWQDVETDGYVEAVTLDPDLEGADPGPASTWNAWHYLLANQDPASAAPILQFTPDYIHSFDVHVEVDWDAFGSNYERAVIRIDSEMEGPDYAQVFRREADVPYGSPPFVVTIPLWTGKVAIRAALIDDDSPNPPPDLDSQSPNKEWTGVNIGYDYPLQITAVGYKLVDIGELDPAAQYATLSFATAVNNLRQVVGSSEVEVTSGDPLRGFFYNDGDANPTNLGQGVYPQDMNDAGFAVGYYENADGVGTAFVSRQSRGGGITSLGVSAFESEAYVINNLGQIIGSRRLDSEDSWHSFLFNGEYIDGRFVGGELVNLGAFSPILINDVGQMVGSQSGGTFLRESDGTLTEITTDTISIPGATGLQHYAARDLNNLGEVVGSISYTLNSVFHREAYRWKNGVMTRLGIGSFNHGDAMAINDAGLVVGTVTQDPYQPREDHAVLWDGTGLVVYLDNFLAPEDAPWHLSAANDINNRGDIVGMGAPNGEPNTNPGGVERHPFLLKRRGL